MVASAATSSPGVAPATAVPSNASSTAVEGSPMRAVGMLALLVGLAGGLGASIQYAQFYGGEVADAQVLRGDPRPAGKTTAFR